MAAAARAGAARPAARRGGAGAGAARPRARPRGAGAAGRGRRRCAAGSVGGGAAEAGAGGKVDVVDGDGEDEPGATVAAAAGNGAVAANGTAGVANGAGAGAAEEAAQPKAGRKWKDLTVRVVAGLGLLAIGGTCIVAGGWPYGLWVSLISYFCAVEYEAFITSRRRKFRPPPTLVRNALTATCVGINVATAAGVRTGVFEVGAFVLLVALLLERSTQEKAKNQRVRLTQLTSIVFGLFYCGYLPSFWIRLRDIGSMLPVSATTVLDAAGNLWPVGLVATLVPILIVVAADTGAYLGGKAFGQNPLISISPKKTWEGAWAGLVAACAASLLMQWWFAWPTHPIWSITLACGVFVSSLFGDLIESSMKREAKMKDSGDIIPGHGGILDRFDSYIFTGALVYFFWYWYYWTKGLRLSNLFTAMGAV